MDEKTQEIIKETVNAESVAFIDREPNCTLSFTGFSATGGISHFETIAKMTEITSKGDYTEIDFEVLAGEPEIPDNEYEHLHCTIDDFWDWLGVAASVTGTALCWAAVPVVTLGAATGACIAATIGTVANAGSVISNSRVMFERNKQLFH